MVSNREKPPRDLGNHELNMEDGRQTIKTVLLTGASGFVGSHCLEYWLDKTNWEFILIDSFEHKGTCSRLNGISNIDNHINTKRVCIYRHDLNVTIDDVLMNKVLRANINNERIVIDYIVNLASDSAVERSITDPGICWHNNCNLIYNMLELVRKIKPCKFIHFSTDEVYGQAIGSPHKEWDAIIPSNPYSASKAAQEALVIAYWRTYNLPAVILNAMNIIGERQDKEKFLPKLIYKIATQQTMEIYGTDGQIGSRSYIHAKNVADAILFIINQDTSLFQNGAVRPDRYNIVGDLELDNLQMAEYVAGIMDKPLNYKLIQASDVRRGYDQRYALDGHKLLELGWEPPRGTLESIQEIVRYYISHPEYLINSAYQPNIS